VPCHANEIVRWHLICACLMQGGGGSPTCRCTWLQAVALRRHACLRELHPRSTRPSTMYEAYAAVLLQGLPTSPPASTGRLCQGMTVTPLSILVSRCGCRLCAPCSLITQRTSPLVALGAQLSCWRAHCNSSWHHPSPITVYNVVQHILTQAQQFLDGKLEPYDFAFSYSSIEHSGLGRYGAVLNPRCWPAAMAAHHH
jgi:Caenorhabditis protein of unknown function, DUF268